MARANRRYAVIGLCGVGGAHVDRRGRPDGVFIPGASNPGILREDAGGGVFNALRAAVSRGVDSTLVSVRGGDGAGEFIAYAVKAAGIAEATAVFLDRRSASYTAILDERGDVVAALADMSIYETCFGRALKRKAAGGAIANADAVMIDANPPAEAIAMILDLARGPVHAIAVSPAKVVRYSPALPRLATLFMNRREMAALTGRPADAPSAAMVAALRGLGLARAVVTDGPRPVVAFDGEAAFTLTPPETRAVADVTGAGDALAGACVAALMRGAAFADAVREGVAASVLKLASAHAAERFADTAFTDALARVPSPLSITDPA